LKEKSCQSETQISEDVRKKLPKEVQEYLQKLEEELKKTKKENEHLKDLLRVSEGRGKLDSTNSSKPPSSDGLNKKPTIPGSQRGKSGKKSGGQRGHCGTRLNPISKPDSIVQHPLDQCACGFDLSKLEADKTRNCQVFDIPKIQIQITEHRMESKICPCCGRREWSQPPAGVKGVSAAEYGPQIKAFGMDLMHHHFVPPRRVREILSGITGHAISIGSLMNWSEDIFQTLEPFEIQVICELIEAGVVNFDETGMRSEGKLHWLHSASTSDLTFYGIHAKRGTEAMKAFGILPNFTGVAVHDHWDSYFTFDQCLHALCNSHILRELKFLAEIMKEEWASQMRKLLLKVHRKVEKARSKGKSEFSYSIKQSFLLEYERILKMGFKAHINDPILPNGKQQKGKNLLDRLRDFNGAILRFMNDFRVPFTNNQGEQDIRMNKVKQKISGCFRSLTGGKIFCRIRSYISTMRKRGHTSLAAMQVACLGQPLPILP
jgi:transposase